MSINRKLANKEEIDLLMLGFLFKMEGAYWSEINNACIVGSGTITPCLKRLKKAGFVSSTVKMISDKNCNTFWKLTEKGEKRFLESISPGTFSYLILKYLYHFGKGQEKDIRRELHSEIEDRIIYFTIDKLNKQKLLYKIGCDYDLTVIGREVAEKLSKEEREKELQKSEEARQKDLKKRYGDNRLKTAF